MFHIGDTSKLFDMGITWELKIDTFNTEDSFKLANVDPSVKATMQEVFKAAMRAAIQKLNGPPI